MADLVIRTARADDHDEVSALALRSKGHWGYSAEFLDACRAELTYDESTCGSGRMWVAVGTTIVGFSLIQGEPPTGELAALFVDPPAIGTGCGRRLLAHTLGVARQRGFVRLVLDADPGAESFYLHCGARRIGSSPSGSIPGRELPRLELVVDAGERAVGWVR
jgi:GNAT superfamily N-acetyltransferase